MSTQFVLAFFAQILSSLAQQDCRFSCCLSFDSSVIYVKNVHGHGKCVKFFSVPLRQKKHHSSIGYNTCSHLKRQNSVWAKKKMKTTSSLIDLLKLVKIVYTN